MTPREPRAEGALEACAREMERKFNEGVFERKEVRRMEASDFLAIMRRHGLRGPEPEGTMRSMKEVRDRYLPGTARDAALSAAEAKAEAKAERYRAALEEIAKMYMPLGVWHLDGGQYAYNMQKIARLTLTEGERDG